MLKQAWMLAIETLSWMEMQRLSEPMALARTVAQLGIKDYDAVRFSRKLVSETVRRRNFIDTFIDRAITPTSIEQFNFGVQAFLRLYLYQTRIAKEWANPDVDEAKRIVRLARSILGWKSLQQVEPFLGRILTQPPAVIFENVNDEKRIALQTFHQEWFVDYCFKLLGRAEAVKMLEANVGPLPTYVRLNTLRGGEDEVLSELLQDHITLEKDSQLKFTYRITGSKQPLTKTSSYRQGFFYIQDKASCFAAEAANPQPGMTVIDVCAAPGAKTTYLAQLMRNRGAMYSLDYSIRRMKVWKNEIERMGVEIAQPMIVDARKTLPFDDEVDLVVLDPPCTSTGTFRKLPSAKWRITPRSIERMTGIQWRLLNACVDHVKTGGKLVYATCSITLEENEMLIEKFLKWNPDFSLFEISPEIGLPGFRGLTECRRLYPHIHECNGFFIAKLVRNKTA